MRKERPNTNPTADRGGLRWQKHPANQLDIDAKKRREAIESNPDHLKDNIKKRGRTSKAK